MKVNSCNNISFKSFYTSKALKKSLEMAADNGLLFGAAASVAFSAARPLSIWFTPKTDKENRLIAIAKSLSSSLLNLALALIISLPIALATKKIDKNPKKFLKKEVINSLKDKSKDLYESDGYTFATQLFKLGLGAVVAVPKSILTVQGMPLIINSIERNKNYKKNEQNSDKSKDIAFKSKGQTDKLAGVLGKLMGSKGFLKFVDKYKDTNFPMHIVALTDALSTAVFIQQSKSSPKIKDDRKKALIYNSAISTVLSIGAGYALDKLLDKPAERFIDKFKKINKNDVNLKKQIQGIKIAKPFLILGTIYYIFIPFISTFLAECADKNPKLDLHKQK